MAKDPIRGKTLRWKYADGAMSGKLFEHRFDEDGRVSWRTLEAAHKDSPRRAHDEPPESTKYEVAQVTGDVCVVAYRAASGWTLTSVLDFEAGTVVSIASNEKQLMVQHGTFEEVKRAA